MNVSREAVSVALFNLLKGNLALGELCATITRTPVIWTAVPTTQMPWLQLFKGGPDAENLSQATAIGLTKYVLTYNLWLYVRADPTDVINAESTINAITDAIDTAMQAPNKGQRQTLGGLVTNAWINGGSDWGREMDDENIVVTWKILVETGI